MEMKKTLVLLGALMTLCASLAFAGGGQAAGSGAVAGDNQPFGKYNPAITITSAKSLASDWKMETGDTLDSNPWTKVNHDELGIDVKWAWNVPTEYDQKMAASIAAGDLPDIFHVNAVQFDMLIQGGLVWDLTEIFDTYASPLYKEYYSRAVETFDAAKMKGRLMALPEFTAPYDNENILWVRQDWIDRLKLPNPDSIPNLIKIADAFKNQDPDGNDRADTFGLLVNKDLWGGNGSILGFLAGYNAYDGWLQDRSGNIASGLIQPEMKTALESMADLYKRGIIDREFSTLDSARANEAIVSGKVGMFFGPFYAPLVFMQAIEMNPEMNLVPYPVPSVNGGPAKIMLNNTVGSFYVVNKKFAHPEALVKLFNVFFKKYVDPNPQSVALFASPSGYEYFHLNIAVTYPPNKNYQIWEAIKAAAASGDRSKLDSEQTRILVQIDRYDNKTANYASMGMDWAYKLIFGAGPSTFSAFDQYIKSNNLIWNVFTGVPTPTMVSRQSNLDTMRDEIFTRIIMGELPISAFDTFVADWKRQGGDAITKEVNDWYKARN
jgi:putative aldouronate transport system substrate-binding protein